MQFCPQCGRVVSGSQADMEFKETEKKLDEAISYARRNWLIFLLAIYAIPVVIASIIALADASNISHSIWASTEFQKWMETHGRTYTQADIQNLITTAASLELASGLCAGVSLVLVFMRKYWIIAVIACFAAAILCFWSLFGMLIGLLVGFMLVGAKDIFIDTAKPPETTSE